MILFSVDRAMSANWLKTYYKSIENSSQLRKFKKYLNHSHLWHLTWETAARGVAVGLFVGIVPLVSFQTLMAIGLSILLGANLPIAFLVSWISNPLTILPLAYFTYYVGNWFLGSHYASHEPFVFSWSMDLHNMQMLWSSFGLPFLVGLPIVAIGAALLGYFAVRLVGWIDGYFKHKT